MKQNKIKKQTCGRKGRRGHAEREDAAARGRPATPIGRRANGSGSSPGPWGCSFGAGRSSGSPKGRARRGDAPRGGEVAQIWQRGGRDDGGVGT